MSLKVSVSGIRGIWGDSLTVPLLLDYTQAFASYVLAQGGKKVLLGRDARPTGDLITRMVSSTLNACGLDTTDIGIVPTPTVLFGVREYGYDAGIIVTASHNPVEWNALKFVKAGGTFTGEKDLQKILSYLGQTLSAAEWSRVGQHTQDNTIPGAHVSRVLSAIDPLPIKKRAFRIVLDPVNSAGSLITRELLEKMGCQVRVLNGEMHGRFDRGTEPIPAHLQHMGPAILEYQADAGFAQDPDADRLVLVDEQGRVLSEEMTLALSLEAVLSRTPGDIVINMSTSRMNQDIAEKYGKKCYRTKVGEANVVEGIQQHQALIGGEGNGGVIYPAINTGRDSLTGIALILEYLARTGMSLSQAAGQLPKYTMKKEKFDFQGDLEQLYRKMTESFSGAQADRLDGLRLDWSEQGQPSWIHIRPSNTEPVVRLIGESPDPRILDKAFSTVKALL